jgi:hypothetical protein
MRRVQRQRTKGWRMPPNTVYVGRGSRWGNPWRLGEQVGPYNEHPDVSIVPGGPIVTLNARLAVTLYEHWLLRTHRLDTFLGPLRGKDLACWCPLDQPCHADVLLELASA